MNFEARDVLYTGVCINKPHPFFGPAVLPKQTPGLHTTMLTRFLHYITIANHAQGALEDFKLKVKHTATKQVRASVHTHAHTHAHTHTHKAHAHMQTNTRVLATVHNLTSLFPFTCPAACFMYAPCKCTHKIFMHTPQATGACNFAHFGRALTSYMPSSLSRVSTSGGFTNTSPSYHPVSS